MNVFLLADTGTKLALQHEALAGKSRIGRGKFSAVFDNGDTVLRMTVDPIAYELHTVHFAPTGPHFCRLVNDYGDIGQMHERAGGHPIYLFETEKLQPVRSNLAARRDMQKILKTSGDVHYDAQRLARANRGSVYSMHLLTKMLEEGMEIPQSMLEAIDELSSFVGGYPDASVDFHSGNFMVRPGCGTLVFNDPLCDVSKLDERHQSLSRGAA